MNNMIQFSLTLAIDLPGARHSCEMKTYDSYEVVKWKHMIHMMYYIILNYIIWYIMSLRLTEIRTGNFGYTVTRVLTSYELSPDIVWVRALMNIEACLNQMTRN